MKEYNGHRSWNAWNVSLWIGNDEKMYYLAIDCLTRAKDNTSKAAMMMGLDGERTPDGAIYNRLSVKLALEGLV